MRTVSFIRCLLVPALAVLLIQAVAAQATNHSATVTVDLSRSIGTNKLDIGAVHGQYSLDAKGDPGAIESAKKIIASGCGFQTQSIMGWGPENPEPSPGVFDWRSLDARVDMMTSIPGVTPVITFCTCPGWMKASGNDWSMDEAPTRSHFNDFAKLCGEVARRYYFRNGISRYIVWNEFKGFWNTTKNASDPFYKNWNAPLYVEMYNKVCKAVKQVSAKIQLGGPYLVIEGDGLDNTQWWGENPISSRNMAVLKYWLKNKSDADFFVIDRGMLTSGDNAAHSVADQMARARLIGDICDQIRAITRLPIWFAELYGGIGTNRQQVAYYGALLTQLEVHGASVAFEWQPQDATPPDWPHSLFTDTRTAGGGQPYPLARLFQTIHQNFGPGTVLYKATSSSLDIEALSSAKDTMLTNKSGSVYTVTLGRHSYRVSAYSVLLAPTR